MATAKMMSWETVEPPPTVVCRFGEGSSRVNHAEDVEMVAGIKAIPTMLDVICRTTGMGFAAVARVTEDRWIACSVNDPIEFGLKPGGELKVETTICDEIRGHRRPVVIDHVSKDETFRLHHTPAMYGFESYISMPIVLPDGEFFGTLCAIDPRPAKLDDPATVGMFELFAELVAFHVDAHRKLRASATELDDERHDAELRAQFIAVLGHDLRNPIASVRAGTQMLSKERLSERGSQVLTLMRRRTDRMVGLVDNVLDFARGRLGGGIPVKMTYEVDLLPMLSQVIDELREVHPDRVFASELSEPGLLRCDLGRLGQLLSNLVANAVTHGDGDYPIRILVTRDGEGILIRVSNGGCPIPPEIMAQLFKPFVRNAAKSSAQGLGLGLYIASEVAKVHGGTLTATSTDEETAFSFRMPPMATKLTDTTVQATSEGRSETSADADMGDAL